MRILEDRNKIKFTAMFFLLAGSVFSWHRELLAEDGKNIDEHRLQIMNLYRQGTAGIPELEKALNDKSTLTRRAAVRALADMGEPAIGALIKATDNEDALVRRIALLELTKAGADKSTQYLEKSLADKDVTIREDAVKKLIVIKPRTEEIKKLMQQAQKDECMDVRAPVTAALWPFQKEVVLLKDRPDMADHTARIKLEQSIELPVKGWKFKVDTKLDGHVRQWFKPNLNDSKWKDISIGLWKDAHIGIAWQRLSFTLPSKPDFTAVELRFGAVDESAWVWINGKYAGHHDIGPEGYNKEFSLDVTNELKWGEKNQLTVRVLNTEVGGGIWKPVYIDALKFR
ncbi:MAG: glycoside hydrolase [Candidatus Uhrbacteria bacterium GW2011_GWF2_39_13]|uniref:Glycoside hydrolase n=1 Tax=Candidatus Uhrbacteria bacterium GW2011_GWF2_39_13 TaxID=1618995 RepID=A0A0G0MVD9_9BACT|nr:MAG: glycoside hydrolase [Candidatus Uhrbacteria bacterium GW2011_GWF2_39_13]